MVSFFFKYYYHISIDLTYYGIAMHKGLCFIVPTNNISIIKFRLCTIFSEPNKIHGAYFQWRIYFLRGFNFLILLVIHIDTIGAITNSKKL